MFEVNPHPNHSKTKTELPVGVVFPGAARQPASFLNTLFHISSVNYHCVFKPALLGRRAITHRSPWNGRPGEASIRRMIHLLSRILHCFSLNLKSPKEKSPILSSHSRLALHYALALWVLVLHHPKFTAFEFLVQADPFDLLSKI